MISVYKIKPRFQQLLLPLLRFLHARHVTANGITWAAIVLSLGGGLLLWLRPSGVTFLLIPLCLLMRMMLNALDGMMAKTYHMQSRKGEVLNELGDVVSDLFLYFPLVWLPGLNSYVVLAFLFLSVINEFTGVLAKAVSGERRYDGPMGKSDRALLVGLTLLVAYFFPEILRFGNYIFGVAGLLLFVSTSLRIHHSLK